MKQTMIFTRRNIKLFFKDKGMFFTSLITPMILLLLYSTFLGNLYELAFTDAFATVEGLSVDDSIVGGAVAGQLVSSLLAVCCITVPFCANMVMVQDKITGAARDFSMTPVKSHRLAFGYYGATLCVSYIICLAAMGLGFVYIGAKGWYLSFADVAGMVIDVTLLVMFGTALSSVINYFLSSQGQISAVGSIVSAGYGFICGAYIPISQFGEGLQKVVSLFPGTYGTALLRTHAMGGAFEEMLDAGVPGEMIDALRSTVDCEITALNHSFTTGEMFAVISGWALLAVAAYVVINMIGSKKKKKA